MVVSFTPQNLHLGKYIKNTSKYGIFLCSLPFLETDSILFGMDVDVNDNNLLNLWNFTKEHEFPV